MAARHRSAFPERPETPWERLDWPTALEAAVRVDDAMGLLPADVRRQLLEQAGAVMASLNSAGLPGPASLLTDRPPTSVMADSNADFGPTGPPDLAGPQPLDYYSIGRLPSNGDLWVGSTDSRIVPLLAGNSYAPGTPVKLNNFGEYLLGIDINQYSQVMITSIQGRIFLANTGMPDMSTTIYKDDAGASLNALSLFSFNNSPRGWAVGSMGRSARYDYTMSKWVVGSTGVSSNLHAVQYCGQTYTQTPEVIALAVGADGTILRGGVDTLNTKETNTNTATLFGVTCSMGSTMIGLDEAGMASQQVAAFAVGASGTILRRSVMAAWSKENSTAIPNVNFRAAQSAKFVSTSDYSSYYTWVVGDKGTVMYWVIGSAMAQKVPTSGSMSSPTYKPVGSRTFLSPASTV